MYEEYIKQHLKLSDTETEYKRLYLGNPDIYFPHSTKCIYRTWTEFRDLYISGCPARTDVPTEPPSTMDSILSENAFFMSPDANVSLLFNARYCPPFTHRLDFIKIMYVLRGSFILNIPQSSSITLTEGQFVLVPPFFEQSVFSYHDEDIVLNIFMRATTFETAFSPLLTVSDAYSEFFWNALYGKKDSRFILFKCQKDLSLENEILRMCDVFEAGGTGSSFLLSCLVSTFLANALYSHSGSMQLMSGERKNGDSRFTALMQYIHTHYSTVTLGELASVFNLSEAHLCRYIKSETGVSLSALLKDFRLCRAALLLKNTDLSIEDIMYEIGYTDVSYFYKIFKARFGMTPGSYKNRRPLRLQ